MQTEGFLPNPSESIQRMSMRVRAKLLENKSRNMPGKPTWLDFVKEGGSPYGTLFATFS